MGYLRRDGSPRYIPKQYEIKGNLQRKRRYATTADYRKARRAGKRYMKLIVRQHHKSMRIEEKRALYLAEINGTLDELHDLMVQVKSDPTVASTTVLRRQDGSVVPVHTYKYDEEAVATVSELMSEGMTLTKICKLEGMPSIGTVRKWYRQCPEVKKSLDQAGQDYINTCVDKLMDLEQEVRSGSLGPREASFIADQYKWLAEKLHPKFMQKNSKFNLELENSGEGKVQFNIILAGDQQPNLQVE